MSLYDLFSRSGQRSPFSFYWLLAALLETLMLGRSGSLLSLITLLSLGTAPIYAGGFVTAPTNPAGSNPVSVAVGDFNGDGRLDLAVANQASNTVSVLLGNGDGTFQAAYNYAVGEYPSSVVVADFDGDGHLDLAVGNYSSKSVSILLGNGDGTFQTAQTYAAGTYAYSVIVGDFNGDGRLDLVVANGSGTVSLLLGNGDGSFQGARQLLADGVANSVAVGDFNGDGHLDLAVASAGTYPDFRGTVRILLGKGDGRFQALLSFAVDAYPIPLRVGDFNEDGILDLVMTNGSNSVSILLGNGDGTFQPAQSQSYAAGGAYSAVVVGDINGDGHLDLAVANATDDSTMTILLGNGDGTFQGGAISYAVDAVPRSVAVGDFDGDGHPDLAVANSSGVTILLGRGDGTFRAAPVNYAAGPPGTSFSSSSVTVGDFNGDGIPDVAVVRSDYPMLSIFLGKGDGTLQTGQSYSVGDGPHFVAVGDFNGDGISDLAVTNAVGGTVSILLGNGDGTFQVPHSFVAGTGPSTMALGDFNADGILDLAVACQGPLVVFLGNGDGTFQMVQSYRFGSSSISVAVGDFNGDGHLDLAVTAAGTGSDSDGTVNILLGKGDGSFQKAFTFAAGKGPTSVTVGDFNGDGKQDIVTTSYAWTWYPRVPEIVDDGVRVFLGNGDGTFQAGETYAVKGDHPVSVAVGDFNGDGIPDLVLANGRSIFHWYEYLGTHAVSVMLGNGDGTFQPALMYGPGGYPTSVAVGDFNGDGFPDLVCPVVDGVSVLLNAADWR